MDAGKQQAAEGSPRGGPSGALDRRRLLGWLAGLGVVALLPGCGEDEAAEPTTAATAATTGTTAATTTATATPDCTLTPELTEGPYYLDLEQVRSDITEGKDGLPFELRVLVVDADACEPIKDAAIDIWHCDAGGEYSGVEGDSGTFLRGIQMTGGDGAARFRTIFPGWYQGRAVHIHVKVHLGGTETFTGQLFFDDETLDAVYAREPYVARGDADTSNDSDGIFAQSSGSTIVAVNVADDACSGSVTLGIQRA